MPSYAFLSPGELRDKVSKVGPSSTLRKLSARPYQCHFLKMGDLTRSFHAWNLVKWWRQVCSFPMSSTFFHVFFGFWWLYVVGLGKSHSLTKSDSDVLSTNDWEEGGAGRVINASMNPSQLFLLTWCLTKECKRKPTDVVQCNVRSTPRVTIWDDHQIKVVKEFCGNHWIISSESDLQLRCCSPTLKFGFDLLGL